MKFKTIKHISAGSNCQVFQVEAGEGNDWVQFEINLSKNNATVSGSKEHIIKLFNLDKQDD